MAYLKYQHSFIALISKSIELNLKKLIQVQNQFKTFYNQLVEEDEGVKYPILDDKMNQLPVLTDLFQQMNETCDTYDLYDNASYELCKELEVKFRVQINVLDKT